LASLTRKML